MSSRVQELAIFGASGFAREVAVWAQTATWDGAGFRLAGFIDEIDHDRTVNGRQVLSLKEMAGRAEVFVVAVGDPDLRARLADRAEAVGLRPAPPLVHPSSRVDPASITVEDGAVICAGCTLTTDITLRRHVQVNLHCTVGHDVVLGEFATLAPGVHVSGKVEIGRGAYLGTGAVTVDGEYDAPLRIGDGAVVGAGAVVTRDVDPGTTVVGIPARSR